MLSVDLTNTSGESPSLRALTEEQKDRLTYILERYLAELEQGVPQDSQRLIEENPDLAEPLRLYLDSLSDLQGISAGFSNGSNDATAAPEAVADEPEYGQKRLGDFILDGEIGRGGMGVVYEARQISLGRRVALKVLPFAAVLDSKQIARFKNEAQAAAQLHHPNIVPVFAVGAERGVHYYAMQLIDGQPLDQAIRDLRRQAGLTIDADEDEGQSAVVDRALESLSAPTVRSALTKNSKSRSDHYSAVARIGIDAAGALHAAHEYGVVHRDIKPSNLLLDHQGKVWITDFGLARCQNNMTLTKPGDVVGTMRYMSREQARGKSALVDHRTDIYSLAVTLYELLTLHPAVVGDDEPEVLRGIDQREPLNPRKHRPDIPLDLERVILKGMAKERDDRYATAQEFGDDLQRVLDGKPTIAKPQTIVERAGRWAVRHKRVVGIAAAVALCAAIGFALSTILIAREKLEAERNFQRAEKHLAHAHDAVDRFGAQLAERLAGIPGASDVRRELLQQTVGYYREFALEAAHDPTLQDDLALTYSKIGTLTDEIGSTDEALRAHEKAVKLFRDLVTAHPSHWEYRRRLAMSYNNLALSLGRAGRVAEAREAYREAMAVQQQLVSLKVAPAVGDLALSYTNLGLLQTQTDEVDAGIASFREAIRLQERLLKEHKPGIDLLRKLAASYNNLGAAFLPTDSGAAVESYAVAIQYQKQAADLDSNDLRVQSDLALTYNNLGAARSRRDDLEQASVAYEQAIALQQRLTAAVPLQRNYRRDLAVSYNNRGLLQSKLRDPNEAEQSFLRALSLQKELIAQDPHDPELQSGLGGMYNNLGIVTESLNRLEDAATAYKRAVDHQRIAFSQAPQISRFREFLSKHYYNYSQTLRALGQPDQAARAAIARRELWPSDPQRLVSVAEELAALGAEIEGRPNSSLTAQQCTRLIVETLQMAVTAGFVVPEDLPDTKVFAYLKKNEAFLKFLDRQRQASL